MKYKTLLDGVKAFPEMSKDVLPILEELVHFHNCVCFIRTGGFTFTRIFDMYAHSHVHYNINMIKHDKT